jgi:hypothetical protein
VLGVSNLALLFLSRALAAEQLAADKAKLNLEVLQRQVGAGLPARALPCSTLEMQARISPSAGAALSPAAGGIIGGGPATGHFSFRVSFSALPPRVSPRQAKGLQAEYTRATSSKAAGGGGDGGGGDEAARLRGQVDALIREKAALQAAADEAAAARRGAQAQVEAMRDQSKVGGARGHVRGGFTMLCPGCWRTSASPRHHGPCF